MYLYFEMNIYITVVCDQHPQQMLFFGTWTVQSVWKFRGIINKMGESGDVARGEACEEVVYIMAIGPCFCWKLKDFEVDENRYQV